MPSADAEPISASPTNERDSFFRQSGWLMIANIGGGAFTWAVHFLSKLTGPEEYGIFVTLLASIIVVPTLPLQMVMAQQTAKSLATNRQGELRGMIRLIWMGTSLLWLVGAILALVFQNQIMDQWKLSSPIGLWLTLLAILLSLWQYLFWGVLQGQQNFLWLGWSMIINAVGRFVIAALLVIVIVKLASSMMAGVLLGITFAVAVAIYHTRALWLGPSHPYDRQSLLNQVIPLMLGFAAFQFLFTADTLFAKAYFDKDTVGYYGSAGTLSRALIWLVGPLASVMFPRIVESATKAKKSNLMGLVLLGTAVLGILGAVSLSVLGPFVVRLVYRPEFVADASRLIPWYAGAMVPLALANVMLSNLLARSLFKIVLPLCILAVLYGFALSRFHATTVMVLQTMAVFNLLLLGICAVFTWLTKDRSPNLNEEKS